MVTSKIGQNDDLSAGPVFFHAAVRLDDPLDAVDRAADESGTRSANLRQEWCKGSGEQWNREVS
jgi:hypothetical protein